jgi:DNA-binding GntR family transcriptional regulator
MSQTNSNFGKSPKPLKSESQINQLRAYLNDKPRDLLLFELSIQTGVPMKRLLALKVKDLVETDAYGRIAIGKGRGQTPYSIIMTKSLRQAWENYLKHVTPSENDYVFKSRKGAKPLNLSTVSNMVNEWFERANISNTSGIRSLKKTWESHFRNNLTSAPFLKGLTDSIAVLQPVTIATAQEIVYDRLMDAILSGRILPGQRLRMQDIANQMNVSRVPVREAFLRLQAGGFISAVKKSAAVVMELSRENLEETLEIRITIESMAARKAAVICSDSFIQRLGSLHQEFVKAIRSHDVEKTLKVNRQFHFAMYREANMPILMEIIESLWNRIIPYFNILLRVMSEAGNPLSQESSKYHEAMLIAMKNHDPEAVTRLLKVDLTEAYKIVYDLFDKLKGR